MSGFVGKLWTPHPSGYLFEFGLSENVALELSLQFPNGTEMPNLDEVIFYTFS